MMIQTETTVTTEVATTVAAPKAPSKKSMADAIFASHLADRASGRYLTNKEFRAAVLSQIQTDLGVSVASAATMYNAAKKAAETADAAISLGRDPKKEKPVSTGKRGRPQGSKNKPKAAPVDGGTVVINAPVAAPVAVQEDALM